MVKPRHTLQHGLRCGLLMVLLLLPSYLVGCLGAPDPLPTRPIAVAGFDQFGTVGIPVSLDGSRSQYPETETADQGAVAFTYTWSFVVLPEGSLLVDDDISPNASPGAALTSFIPDYPGRYVVQLLVEDGTAQSIGDFTVIEVEGTPEKPIADAGSDQQVEQGMAIYLDGSSSHHPEGAALYYRWTLAGAPSLSTRTNADVVNPYTPYPSLIVDTGGVFTFALVVSDGVAESDPDYVFITVASINSPPIAQAGQDRTIQACTDVTLDGSDSYDVNGDPLAYQWEVLISPLYSGVETSTLLDAQTALTGFSSDKLGNYVVQLTVSDGAAFSVPDVVNLTAVPRSFNTPPVAEAGEPLKVTGKVTCSTTGGYCPDCPAAVVNLDGTASSDPDGDTLSYLWSVPPDGPGQVLVNDPNSPAPAVELRGAKTSIGATATTVFRVQLDVTDCPGATAQDFIEIRYECTGGT